MRIWCAILLSGCWVHDEIVVVSEPQQTGVIDFRLPPCGDSVALRELDRRAIALGADTVVGPQVIHEDESVHVTGLAMKGR
jgi:hypothetical protein